MIYSIENILNHSADLLSNSPTPRLDLEILLSYVLQKPKAFLYTHSQDVLSENTLNVFETLMKRRQQDEPIAYLVGHQPFWNLDLIVSKETLIPRPETELLVETVLTCLPAEKSCRVLDLGTGSGAVTLAIASERLNWFISGVDSSEPALHVAEANKNRHRLNNVLFKKSFWFSGLNDELFNAIVSNPPYLSEDDAHLESESIRFEPRDALVSGHDGLEAIRLIINEAKHHLKIGGFLILEHGFEQGEALRVLFAKQGYSNISTLKDLAGLDRVTYGCKK